MEPQHKKTHDHQNTYEAPRFVKPKKHLINYNPISINQKIMPLNFKNFKIVPESRQTTVSLFRPYKQITRGGTQKILHKTLAQSFILSHHETQERNTKISEKNSSTHALCSHYYCFCSSQEHSIEL